MATILPLALTYSDVLLVPKKTPLSSRTEAQTASFFTPHIPLQIPFASANMATVTEHAMAIALARLGGIGCIHQFCSIEEEEEEVRMVKRSTSYTITNPLSIPPTTTLREAQIQMEDMSVSSALITDGKKLLGILTKRDYEFVSDPYVPVRNLMTGRQHLVTGTTDTTLAQAKQLLSSKKVEKLPLVNYSDEVVGLITSADIRSVEHWPAATRDADGHLRVAAAVGVKDTIERSDALLRAGADCIVLDIAHAHADVVIQALQEWKYTFPSREIVVGNIATAAAAHDLIAAGADGLKVGIGPSPVCTTRIIAGAGIPQLTAVMQVVEAAKGHSVTVIADGGMSQPGDVNKAIAAGASAVFSGSIFAGTDEAPGMIILKDGKRYKKYAGSAAYDSNHVLHEKKSGTRIKKRLDLFVEGVATLVDYKGPVQGVIDGFVKGLKSGISYCGAHTIAEMQANAEFVQITQGGWTESGSRGTKLSE